MLYREAWTLFSWSGVPPTFCTIITTVGRRDFVPTGRSIMAREILVPPTVHISCTVLQGALMGSDELPVVFLSAKIERRKYNETNVIFFRIKFTFNCFKWKFWFVKITLQKWSSSTPAQSNAAHNSPYRIHIGTCNFPSRVLFLLK